jgi:hypothetical protein
MNVSVRWCARFFVIRQDRDQDKARIYISVISFL